MVKRITMQQLADACGLSRNTVSKIFNNRGSVPETTRRLVLQRARELGYYALSENPATPADPAPAQGQTKTVALLTRKFPEDAHVGTYLLPAFTEQLSRSGYTLMMYRLTPEELRECRLPAHMPQEQTDGILTIELFDRDYMNMLCETGLPCLSVDACAEFYLAPIRCDLIMMENTSSAIAVTKHAITAGAKKLGFVGDPNHCESFRQRWTGFCRALAGAGLELDEAFCVVDPDSSAYSDEDWILARFRQLPQMPDALICANDFLALHVLAVLKRLNLTVPGDIMVTGFDGTPQSAVVEPSLTTVQVPSTEIGRMAADMLLERIRQPELPFRNVYVNTTPQWRMSTKR